MTLQTAVTTAWMTPPPSVAEADRELAAVLAELAEKRQLRREVVTEILELESDRRYLRDYIAMHGSAE